MERYQLLRGKLRERSNGKWVLYEDVRIERLLLAKLASEKPEFFNPLEAVAAERLRDAILKVTNQ